MEEVVLVDENDNEVGTAEKLEAHKKGLLHRAFSVFIFNSKGELLLQRRASDKYHSGGLWSNTCCSHPRPGEKLISAATRRLKEEMGIETTLSQTFSFTYKVNLENGLTEHEYDHVFLGVFDGSPKVNPSEATDWKWIDVEDLKKDIEANPRKYTYWLKEPLEKLGSYIEEIT